MVLDPKVPQHSEDYDRIVALPRVHWTPEATRDAQRTLTGMYARLPSVSLFPIQALSLVEAAAAGGLLAGISVGGGKTLLSFLLCAIWQAQRPLLLVPARLKSKTTRARRKLADEWRIPTGVTIWSYESLSTDNKSKTTRLERMAPDVIICDEAQALRNMNAARWRKFARYCAAGRPKLAFLSGSLMQSGLMDWWHLARGSLGSGSPLPLDEQEARKWAAAVDPLKYDFGRTPPGILTTLARPRAGESPLEQARRGIRGRLRCTRGVVLSVDDDIETRLVINRIEVDVPDEVMQPLKVLREDSETPNGEFVDPGDTLAIWRHAREMACGFYQRWTPPAPLEWLLKRKAWARVESAILATNCGLDSPYMVRQEYAHHPAWQAWQAIEPSFVPMGKPYWLSDYMVQLAVRWLKEHGQLVWVEHPIVGHAIAKLAECRYYGSGVNDLELAKKGPAVASIAAQSEGNNLQGIWDRMLVLSVPPGGGKNEQMIGRLYRHGQTSDEVVVDMVLPTKETRDGLRRAIRQEKAVGGTIGGKRRLLRAEYTFDPFDI